MRTREELQKIARYAFDANSTVESMGNMFILEVLLDIRELLANPPEIINGVPLENT